jgi:hypothetical protein
MMDLSNLKMYRETNKIADMKTTNRKLNPIIPEKKKRLCYSLLANHHHHHHQLMMLVKEKGIDLLLGFVSQTIDLDDVSENCGHQGQVVNGKMGQIYTIIHITANKLQTRRLAGWWSIIQVNDNLSLSLCDLMGPSATMVRITQSICAINRNTHHARLWTRIQSFLINDRHLPFNS